MGEIALPTFLLIEQGTAVMGLFLAGVSLSNLLALPFAGKLADRLPRGALIRAGYILSAIAPLLLLWSDSTTAVVAAAVTMGGGWALGTPASRAGLADLVGLPNLARAQGSVSALQNVIGIAAPGLGGAAIVWWTADGLLSVQAAASLLAAVATPGLPNARKADHDDAVDRNARKQLRGVFRPMWLRAGLAQTALQVLLGFAPGLVLMRIVATDRYGSEGLGLVLSAGAGAALVGSVVAALVKPRRPGLWANLGFVSYVPVFAVLAIDVPLPLFMAAVLLGGVGISLHGVWWYVALNVASPPQTRGRVHAVDATVTKVLEPVGMGAAAPVSAIVGVPALAGVGATVFLLAPLLALLVPGFMTYGKTGSVTRPDPPPPAGGTDRA
ncbi:MFS transporter [Streptomyces scopuliridis]|uniref:MFS transporter n=2 Tax=Streptomyces scopuliridis TaxID=452529 RepID=A0ACD4ZBW5_9ACTN|nr:MFS transporter [Streptomyces scopuliridis]WSC10696.1 MFS transporter [Streptomyces scopuliridis]